MKHRSSLSQVCFVYEKISCISVDMKNGRRPRYFVIFTTNLFGMQLLANAAVALWVVHL